jgi:hypothetical protein
VSLSKRERYWRRRYRRLARALARQGGVAKVKLERPDGSFAFGVFVPFTREELAAERQPALAKRERALRDAAAFDRIPPTSRLAPGRGRDRTRPDGERWA